MVAKHQKSQILLSGKRSVFKENGYVCFATLNLKNENFIGSLQNIYDAFLEINASKSTLISKNACVLFLPLIGSIQVNNQTINAGNVFIQNFNKNDKIHIRNLHPNLQANFIEIHVDNIKLEAGVFHFNLNNYKNQLNCLINQNKVNVSIGLFDARHDITYKLKNKKNTLGYVIQGAFEFQNILLEHRDSAVIFNPNEAIEFEALSENALIILIET